MPVLNEQDTIKTILDQFVYMPGHIELIIVDGGSTDATGTIIRNWMMRFDIHNAQYFASPRKGRAAQMNHGAARAQGDVLLFLHADTRLPRDWEEAIIATFSNQDHIGGAFQVEFTPKTPFIHLIEVVGHIRNRLSKKFYGDQGIFVRRDTFEKIGGFPDVSLMEDVLFSSQMKQRGTVSLIEHPRTITSSRRFLRYGIRKTVWTYLKINTLFYLGVSPDKLEKYYK